MVFVATVLHEPPVELVVNGTVVVLIFDVVVGIFVVKEAVVVLVVGADVVVPGRKQI